MKLITIQNGLGELESQYRYITFNINIVPTFPPAARFSFPVTENNDKSIHLSDFLCIFRIHVTALSVQVVQPVVARFEGQTTRFFIAPVPVMFLFYFATVQLRDKITCMLKKFLNKKQIILFAYSFVPFSLLFFLLSMPGCRNLQMSTDTDLTRPTVHLCNLLRTYRKIIITPHPDQYKTH